MNLNENIVISGNVCLIDSATTHIILREPKYFLELIPIQDKLNTTSGPVDVVEGSRKSQCDC